MRFLPALPAAVLALGLSGAMAQTPVTYAEGDRSLFTVDVPDFWSVRTGGPRTITLPDSGEARTVTRVLAIQPTTEDGVWMGFVSPPGVSTLAEARSYLRDVGRFLALDADVGPVSDRRIGGYPAQVFSGTGRRNGQDLQFSVALIDMPGDRVGVATAVVEAGTDPDFIFEINDVFASFRAIQ